MRSRWDAPGAVGGSRKVVSERLVQRAMRCIASVSSPAASSTTATGLPSKRRSEKTSTTA